MPKNCQRHTKSCSAVPRLQPLWGPRSRKVKCFLGSNGDEFRDPWWTSSRIHVRWFPIHKINSQIGTWNGETLRNQGPNLPKVQPQLAQVAPSELRKSTPFPPPRLPKGWSLKPNKAQSLCCFCLEWSFNQHMRSCMY